MPKQVKETYAGGQYKPLTHEQIEKIHKATLQVLENTGVEINHREALELLAKNGARVDFNSKKAYLTAELIERCVDSAPSDVVLYGREDKHNLDLSGERVYMGTGGTALNVLDLEGKRRRSQLKDLQDIARLVDALENIHFYVCPVFPNELAKEVVDVNRFYSSILNTSKHIMGGVYTVDGVRKVVELSAELAGGLEQLQKKPFISIITCIMSPLKFDATYTELMFEAARNSIPLATPSAPLAGATGPATLAGTLVQANAEALAGIVLVQLAKPGNPVLYSAVPTTIDMRNMAFCFGSVEMGIMNAASAQLSHYYKLPVYNTAGVSDSKIPDAQAGYEKAATALMAGLAGSNFIHDAAGLLEGAMTASYAQYVIDNEIIGMAMRSVRGIEVTDDTLAVDAINNVGPAGNYLSDAHTIKYMKSECFFNSVADRQSYPLWSEAGSTDACQRATQIAGELIATHKPLGVSDKLDTKIRAMIPEII